ncbi:MAG: M24 family metallopeptidase [Actinomycetota bacterium]|nr:M24 family metallopeptidase [Actinomycetota bacterium]
MTDLFTSRIKNLKNILKKKELHSIIILNYSDIFYLTGFYGVNSGSILLLTDDCSYLIVNFIYLEQAEKSVKNKGIEVVLYGRDKFKKIKEILEGYEFKSVALEWKDISYKYGCILKRLLKMQDKELKDAGGILKSLRSVKDKEEIKKIKSACRITDKSFKNILKLKPVELEKLSEIELAFYMEELLIKKGSNGKSFDIIAAYDKSTSIPHYIPQKKYIKSGAVLMDFGCRFENYCSDMTRTIFTRNNKKCNEFKKIYDIVLRAQLKAIDYCRAGISAGKLDSVARNFISSKGYGDNFGHGLGHGVGLEIHEEPFIKKGVKTVLKENMVITIEPGIYVKNFGGVRIEDAAIVKKNKCEVLYSSRKDFFVMDL